MIIVAAFLACLIPALLIYLWLKSRRKDVPGYRESCRNALVNGLICAGPVVLSALVLNLAGSLAGLKDLGEIFWAGYKTFILAALVEEVCKFLMFRRVLGHAEYDFSWYDAAAFMTLVGLGFEISESVVYAFIMNPGQAIVRGVTAMHGVFGFITGYFYGRSLRTGKKGTFILGFLLTFLYHGLYDFSLEPAVAEMTVFDFIAVTLALAAVVGLIIMFVFFSRRRKNERYIAPLGIRAAPEDGGQPETP